MFKVYGYISSDGCGQMSIGWFTTPMDPTKLSSCQKEDWANEDENSFETVLTFESREAAIAAGIPSWIGPFEYEGEDE